MDIMHDLRTITADVIEQMNYNQIIGLVRETNRAPGGRRSINHVAQRIHLTSHVRALDVGTSTGSTAIELALLTGCAIIGIDINEQSLQEATARTARLGLQNVTFQHADAAHLPFPDETFDLVFCGNLMSIVASPTEMYSECRRVTKSNGYIAAIPMYYRDTPPTGLLAQVSRAIGLELTLKYRQEAVVFYQTSELDQIEAADFRFDDVAPAEIETFVEMIMGREHLQQLSPDAFSACRRRYREFLLLFRENLKHMGYTILVFRKTSFKDDPELFTSRPLPI
jgi:ubiquinone/menaquinone biosynthesis C-methylase UbiE